MPFQSLKFKIAGNLSFIILLAILLTDFVVINIVQKNLISKRIETGQSILSDSIQASADKPDFLKIQFKNIIAAGTGEPSFKAAYLLQKHDMEFCYGFTEANLFIKMKALTARTLGACRSSITFEEKTWGVFWHQKKYVLISDPVTDDQGRCIAAKTLVLALDDIYDSLRQSQKIIALYAIANFIILLLFGIYRMSRLIIKPIHRFIRLTDNFREKDRLYFAYGAKYQEFNQLSKALNHMMDQIESDKARLQDSLQALEKVNMDLQNAQQEMIKTEKLASIGRLSAGIAHEIGNPVGIVLGYLDLLKSLPLLKNDIKSQDYIDRSTSEINRINTIIRQLLDFSRTSSVDYTRVSVNELVSDVGSVMSQQPLTKEIKIEFDLQATHDLVLADYGQLRQVLLNLIINAADSIKGAKKTDGYIMLSTENRISDTQNLVNLSVVDNGAGILKENIDNIFDPFFTTKEPGKGTGLGLSVSYMIIEQLGGKISADSVYGEGTVMTVSLPLADND